MCGIAGIFDGVGPNTTAKLLGAITRMADALYTRGPDHGDYWVDASIGIGLGHRRLSILDLSPQGNQPMHSACGRYVIAFNGEIYNFQEIKVDLERYGGAPAWRGHSDTEVLLAAISHWGFAATLERLVGMFAIALWDKQQRTLYLARDRLGEKPLYYGWVGNAFVFGSELKALRAHPSWRGEINRDALALYVTYSYVPTPYSIYKDVLKLPPGTFLSVPIDLMAPDRNCIGPTPYWDAKRVAESGVASSLRGSDQEAIGELESLLKRSIAQQMVADVPLGAFLSGGVDSSTVVALMQEQSNRPIRTFTIGFDEAGYNEAEQARAVARHLGTDHTELYVSPQDALSVIPQLPHLYDEPFSDSSQIPTFLVSKLARHHVTVSLSGDGGDELFGGYNRYLWGAGVWNKARLVPRPLRTVLAAGMTALAPATWDKLFSDFSTILPARYRQRTPGDKMHKLAGVLDVRHSTEMYGRFVSHWSNAGDLVLDSRELPTAPTDHSRWADLPTFAERMMFLDMISYMPDDILVKIDRAAMGVSLETRIPMLDHRVVEFASRLPLHMKIRDGQGKWLLRQVLYKYVPKVLVKRPKAGFGIPLDSWLRCELRDWAEALLDPGRLLREGFFNPVPIRVKWEEHLSGRRNWQYYLWDVLMFQAWLEAQS